MRWSRKAWRWVVPFGLSAGFAGGCGGGGGNSSAAQTSVINTQILSVKPVGPSVPLPTIDNNFSNQYLLGHVIIGGEWNNTVGIYYDGTFKAMPTTISGAISYEPGMMAGTTEYGQYQNNASGAFGGFAWDISTGIVTDMGGTEARCVSPSGNKVAFQTEIVDSQGKQTFTASILDVPSGQTTTFNNPTGQEFFIDLVSDSGSGVGEFVALSSGQAVIRPHYSQKILRDSGKSAGGGVAHSMLKPVSRYRFTADGTVLPGALSATPSYPYLEVMEVNSGGWVGGDLVGSAVYQPVVYAPGSTTPSMLGIPTTADGVASCMNQIGGAGGSYFGPPFGQRALLWPNVQTSPSSFIDVNKRFPLPHGAVITNIVAMDPSSQNFLAWVSAADGSQTFQTFQVN